MDHHPGKGKNQECHSLNCRRKQGAIDNADHVPKVRMQACLCQVDKENRARNCQRKRVQSMRLSVHNKRDN